MYTILHNRLSRCSRVEVDQVWNWFCWPLFWAWSMTCLKFEYLYIYPNVCQREIKITWGLIKRFKVFHEGSKTSLSLSHTHRQTNRDTCTSIPHGSNKCTPTSSNLWKPNHHSQYWWWWNQRAYPRNYSLFPRVWASGRINVSMPKELLTFQFKNLRFLVQTIRHYTFDHRCKMHVPFSFW